MNPAGPGPALVPGQATETAHAFQRNPELYQVEQLTDKRQRYYIRNNYQEGIIKFQEDISTNNWQIDSIKNAALLTIYDRINSPPVVTPNPSDAAKLLAEHLEDKKFTALPVTIVVSKTDNDGINQTKKYIIKNESQLVPPPGSGTKITTADDSAELEEMQRRLQALS